MLSHSSRLLRVCSQPRVHHPSLVNDFPEHIISIASKRSTNILTLVLHNLSQKRNQLKKLPIFHIIIPSLDEDPVFLLVTEVFAHVVDYYSLGSVSPNLVQIFYDVSVCESCVLTVKSVFNKSLRIYLINYSISIVLHGCSKNHKLPILGQLSQKFCTAWPYKEKRILFILHKMNKSLVKVKD